MNSQKAKAVPRSGALIISPANALAMTLVGYYSMAGLANAYLPDSSLGGVLIRAAIGAVMLLAFARFVRYRRKTGSIFLLPAAIFLTLYFFRMYENAFISQLTLPPNSEAAILLFLVSLLMPAIFISLIAGQIDDRQFDQSMRFLLIIFGASLFFNWENIIVSSESRLLLDKVNPISMSMTAFTFVLYHLLRFRQSKALMIQAVIVLPVLLFIIVYARSRGVYIAGAATLIIYGLMLKGTRRFGYLLSLGLLGVATATWLSDDALVVVTENLQRILSGNDLSANIRRDAAFGGWNQFLQDPVFGRYIIEFSTDYYVHNMYLESLMAVGMVGTLFLVLHLIFAYRAVVGIIRSPQSPFIARFSGALMIFMSIIAASSSAVYLAAEFWVTSFLVITVWYGRIGFLRTSASPNGARQFRRFDADDHSDRRQA